MRFPEGTESKPRVLPEIKAKNQPERREIMKKIIIICTAFALALLNVPAGVYAQTMDSYVILDA